MSASADVEMKELAGASTAPTNTYNIEIKNWSAYVMWSWDIKIENCAICRNGIGEPCIECVANPDTSCNISWGACNHAYHTHCINRWLKTRNVCPMDNQTWELTRISDASK